jgi:hypothetical protein
MVLLRENLYRKAKTIREHTHAQMVLESWMLVALVLFAQGSYFFAVAALPKGRPPSRGNLYDWTLSLVFLISAIGLGWMAKILGLL